MIYTQLSKQVEIILLTSFKAKTAAVPTICHNILAIVAIENTESPQLKNLLEDISKKYAKASIEYDTLVSAATRIANREWVCKVFPFHLIMALVTILKYYNNKVDKYAEPEAMFMPYSTCHREWNSILHNLTHRHIYTRMSIVDEIATAIQTYNSIIITGQPNVGKLTVVMDTIRHILHGKYPMLYNSMVVMNPTKQDMTELIQNQPGARIISIITKNSGDLLSEDPDSILLHPIASRTKFIYVVDSESPLETLVTQSIADAKCNTIIVPEPNEDETSMILQEYHKGLSGFLDIQIDNTLYKYITQASSRFSKLENQPIKAIQMFSEAVFILCNKEITKSIRKVHLKPLHEYTPEDAIDEITNIGILSYTNLMQETSKTIYITTQDIDNLLVSKYDIKSEVLASLMSVNVRSHLQDLQSKMQKVVFGQDTAIEAVVKSLWRRALKIDRLQRPISFILIGKTGTGKTFLAKTTSKLLQGSEDKMIRFDMSEYKERHEVSKLIGCFTPNTEIRKDNGRFETIDTIDIGAKVVQADGTIGIVKDKYIYTYKGNMKRITVANLPEPICCTPKHEIKALQTKVCNHSSTNRICEPSCESNCSNRLHINYVADWISASNLKVGDFVTIPHVSNSTIDDTIYLNKFIDPKSKVEYKDDKFAILPPHRTDQVKYIPNSILIDEDFATLCGLFIANGSSNSNGKSIDFSFHKDETDTAAWVSNTFESKFGYPIKFSTSPVEILLGKKRIRGHFSSIVVNKMFKTLFGSGPCNKNIPNILMNQPTNIKLALFNGLVGGDGSTKQPNKITYKTPSKVLAKQVFSLLTDIGIVPFLQLYKPINKKWSTIYTVDISGKQVKIFEKLNSLKSIIVENTRMAFINNNTTYLQITNIEDVDYNGLVYDLSVDNNTSYIANFIGVHNSPPGFVGSNQPGKLTDAVSKNPHAVILFDEIEKAHPDILDIFLQILDDGRLTSNHGVTVDFTKTIIFMSSNIGCQEAHDTKVIGFGQNTESNSSSIIMAEMKKQMRPEFINRLQHIIMMNNLTTEQFVQIANARISEIIASATLKIRLVNDICPTIVKTAESSKYNLKAYNAREIHRIITDIIENKIIDLVAAHDYHTINLKAVTNPPQIEVTGS